MSNFTPLKRNCPVCSGLRRDCRQNKQSSIVHCRADLSIVPPGWKALGQDTWGFEMYIEAAEQQNPEAWQERQRERQAQRQRELEELRRGALPEAERDTAIRRIHRHFGLSSKHREDLRDRGLSDTHIDRLPYFSFHPNQEVPQFTPANLPGVRRGRLAVKESGFACPIPDINGQIIGWQNRFDDTTNGKYRWPVGQKSAHLPNGELPIGVYRPDSGVARRAIGHGEGFPKPHVIAQQWGLPTLGAASANFAASPEQWKASLDQLSAELWTRIIYWFADAGSVRNPHVTSQYLKSWEKLAEWGYSVKIVWWGQIEKSAGDADEISQEVRESARLISTDEYLAIAKQYGGIREATATRIPSEQRKTQDPSISRDEWELKFGDGIWLKRHLKRLKRLGNWQKSYETSVKPQPPLQPASQTALRYDPDKPLPRPEDFADQNLPKIIFEQGQRLEVLAKLRELGWKFVCDRSFTGSGKSHDAGSLFPDPDGSNKIWYFDLNHTNPSTETIENMTNLPPRHNGMVQVAGKSTPKGNPHLKWASNDISSDVPRTPSLCHYSNLFIGLKSKGWDIEDDLVIIKPKDGKKPLIRNKICAGCRWAYKCHEEKGEGYGYLLERREALEKRRLRASLDSAPNPHGEKAYDYSEDLAFVEEASRYLRGVRSLSAWGNELALLWGYVERKAPEAFEALQSIRFALQDALNGDFDCIEKGINWGAGHEILIENLPQPSAIANLPALIHQVKTAMPTIKDIVTEADSVVGLGGKWRSAGQFARNMMKSQAAHQTKENIESLPPNVLVDILEIWAGIKSGSLRVLHKQFQIVTQNSRHSDILNACGFVVLLDATPNMQYLEKILGDAFGGSRSDHRILEIEQERPPLSNLTVVDVDMEGMGSNQISDTCKTRQLALLDWIQQQHQEVKVLANKADSHLPLDGWWFNDNRGSNAFKGVEALASFNTPRPNLGVVQDEYRALFGSLNGFEDYYQRLIQAEIIQLIGRQRSHLYPDKQFRLYLVTTNQNLSYLSELGCQVTNREAFHLTPFAGTPAQITRWKILQAASQLQDQGKKITQDAIAAVIGNCQGSVSKTINKFGNWKLFKKILLALLGIYRGSNNFESLTDEEKWLAQIYLPMAVAEPEVSCEELVVQIIQIALGYGIEAFEKIIGAAPVSTQAQVLTAVLRMLPRSILADFADLLPEPAG